MTSPSVSGAILSMQALGGLYYRSYTIFTWTRLLSVNNSKAAKIHLHRSWNRVFNLLHRGPGHGSDKIYKAAWSCVAEHTKPPLLANYWLANAAWCRLSVRWSGSKFNKPGLLSPSLSLYIAHQSGTIWKQVVWTYKWKKELGGPGLWKLGEKKIKQRPARKAIEEDREDREWERLQKAESKKQERPWWEI